MSDKSSASTATILEGSHLTTRGMADVFRKREKTRMKKVLRAIAIVFLIDAFLWRWYATGHRIGMPKFGPEFIYFLPVIGIFIAIFLMAAIPLISGKSPHITVYPEQVEFGLSDIKGLDTQVDEVIRTIDVFLGYATFREELGGTPRRGILFEGPPGTGKTFLAKAMAKQAGVPFLFISAPAFQSMWQGMTAFRIRSFFKNLRKAARKEGGAIGFIEEIDAIGGTAGRYRQHGAVPGRNGVGGGRALARDLPVHRRRQRRHGQRAADPDAVVRSAAVARPHEGEAHHVRERLPAARPAVHRDAARSTTTSC